MFDSKAIFKNDIKLKKKNALLDLRVVLLTVVLGSVLPKSVYFGTLSSSV